MAEEKCVHCGKVPKYPDFACKAQPGNCEVAPKVYYHPGATTCVDIRDRKVFNPTVVLKAGQERVVDGRPILEQPVEAQFYAGKLQTTDAEKQYYLDRKGGWLSQEQYDEIYNTPDELIVLKRRQLAELDAQLKQKNPLLEEVQKGKK